MYYIPTYKGEVQVKPEIEVIHEKPVSIEGEQKVQSLVLADRRLDVDGVFILRESVSPANLIPGIEMDGNHIAVNRRMETNLKGCFACGDIAGAPYQYIKSAGEGNVAALSAAGYLDLRERTHQY